MSERYQIVMINYQIIKRNAKVIQVELSLHMQLKIGIATKSQIHTVDIVL